MKIPISFHLYHFVTDLDEHRADEVIIIISGGKLEIGHYACLWRSGNDFDSCLCACSSSPNSELCDVFTIIDWESLLVLPQHIAFKGSNGKYLSARLIDGLPYLQFASDDSGEPTVGNEVFTTPDGSIRTKSGHFGKLWRINPDDSDLDLV